MLEICLLGTGGMMPLPKRWLTSLMIRYNGSCILVDCGEGTQITAAKEGWSFKPIDAIVFTHYHADHISGLPGLLLAMANSERTDPIKIIGPKGLERVFRGLTVIAQPLPFEVELYELKEHEETMDLCGLSVTAFRVNHRAVCYGYSFELTRKGKFDVERAKAKGIPLKYWNPLQKGMTIEEDGQVFTPDMVLGADRKGIKVTYCTDTRPTDSIVRNAAGSDIFICEGMYGDPEKHENAVTKKHMTMQEAAHLAKEAGVGEMWLTHYSPSMMHPERYLKELENIFPNTVIGKDGMFRNIPFEEEEQ